MSVTLPDSVRIFGIECHGERGIYSCRDEDKMMTVEVMHSIVPRPRYAAIASGSDWTVEGPWKPTPQEAVDALHALVKRLAGEIG